MLYDQYVSNQQGKYAKFGQYNEFVKQPNNPINCCIKHIEVFEVKHNSGVQESENLGFCFYLKLDLTFDLT